MRTFILLLLIPLSGGAATLVVDNSGDGGDTAPGNGTCTATSGGCTLRAAIEEANANADPGDVIEFAIPTTDPGYHCQGTIICTAYWWTITPDSELPILEGGITIDGWSAGTSLLGNPTIELDCQNCLSPSLSLREIGNTVRGLAFTNNGRAFAIHLMNANNLLTTANFIQGNWIGLSVPNGTQPGGMINGILINGEGGTNLIGGDQPALGNVISGMGKGIEVRGSADQSMIMGNFIGTRRSGMAAVPNGVGIRVAGLGGTIIGGSNPGEGNLISGNLLAGIELDIAGGPVEKTQIYGNNIGLAVDGVTPLGNGVGILAEHSNLPSTNGSFLQVGDDIPGAGNVISGNIAQGILITIDSPEWENLSIYNNIIGLAADGVSAAGNGQSGIEITGNVYPNIHRNVISSNFGSGILLHDVISGAPSWVENNIGVDQFGMVAAGNAIDGVTLINVSAQIQLIENVISANSRHGMLISDSSGPQPIRCLIGTLADGSSPAGNGQHGIAVNGATDFLRIPNSPTTMPNNRGNTIAHNGGAGIFIAPGAGNYIWAPENRFFNNADLAIDLGLAGPNPNDIAGQPGVIMDDEDTGSSGLQNYPEIDDVAFTDSDITITYWIPSDPQHSGYPVYAYFYLDDGFGEGAVLIGVDAYTESDYPFLKTITLPLPQSVLPGQGLVAMAVSSCCAGLAGSSEFSLPVLLLENDRLFCDSLEDSIGCPGLF